MYGIFIAVISFVLVPEGHGEPPLNFTIPKPLVVSKVGDYSETVSANFGVNEMKVISRIYDQHNWMNRLKLMENATCKGHMEVYINNLLNGTLWASKMYDASGRYNGNFFFGNDFWLGSWTLCKELQNSQFNSDAPPLPVNFYVAKIKISSLRIGPATRLIHLGLCLPKSCSTTDVNKLLTEENNRDLSLNIADVRPVPGNYSMLQDVKVQIVGISGLITLLLIVVASVVEVLVKKKRNKLYPKDDEVGRTGATENSTSKERFLQDENLKKNNNKFMNLLLAFSAIKNGRKILSVDSVSKDSIGCLHGLRVFSIGWIIMVHTYLEVFGVAGNKSLRTITERNFMFQTISNATFSVDTFFFISGLLMTLGFFRTESAKDKTSKNGIIRRSFIQFIMMISYRFIRLTPAYLFIVGVNEIVMRYIHSNSVFTPAIIDHITCEKYWWRNALYINNLFPQAEICMLWSWYMANDTQFFVLASILLLIAVRGNKQLKYVAVSMGIVLISSWIVTFLLAMKYEYVARVQEPFALFDELYDKPWMRIGPYLVGMIVGYMLFKVKGQMIFSPPVVLIGWLLAISCLGSLVYGLGRNGLVVPASAFYASLGHTAWALALAWITVACYSGYGGPFNVLFSCKLFLPMSRLTYGAYLVHPILMCLTSFALDGSLRIHNMLTVVVFLGNVVLSFLCALLISLGLEAPAINVIKIIFH